MISVSPNPSFSTEKVAISASGLPKNTNVTLYASTVLESGNKFESIGLYKTCVKGKLNLEKDKSYGGTYEDVEPMGFLWAMVPSFANKRPHARFVKKECKTPMDVSIKILQGHYDDFKEIYNNPVECLAQTILQRNYLPNDIEMITLDGEVKGYLFVPKNKAKSPGVINLYGAVAGTFQVRPAALAANGFVVLALIFRGSQYGFADNTYDIDLGYFDKAVKFLKSHPKVNGEKGIGINSLSTGTASAFATIAAGIKGIKCIVGINGPIYTGNNTFVYKSKRMWHKEELLLYPVEYSSPYSAEAQRCLIPFHKIKDVSILYIAGLSDKTHPVSSYANQIEMLCRDEKRTNVEVIRYPDTGHLIEIPYTPICLRTWFPMFGLEMDFGGKPKGHAVAQIDSWDKQINFLKRELCDDKLKPKL